MPHTAGWCDCTAYHGQNDPILTRGSEPKEVMTPVSVNSLIGERDPITGALKPHNLTLEHIKMLVFNEGYEAWAEFTEDEKEKFQVYLHESFMQAVEEGKSLSYVRSYFGDMLLRLQESGVPMIRERA